jgi:hypothetical protein
MPLRLGGTIDQPTRLQLRNLSQRRLPRSLGRLATQPGLRELERPTRSRTLPRLRATHIVDHDIIHADRLPRSIECAVHLVVGPHTRVTRSRRGRGSAAEITRVIGRRLLDACRARMRPLRNGPQRLRDCS